jgi:hypothetical protein
MTLKKIAELHFELSQKNFIWFPFIFLKPASHQTLKHKKVLLMSLCFGTYFYLMQLVWSVLLTKPDKLVIKSGELLFYITLFFLWFECVTRPLWNYSIKHQE